MRILVISVFIAATVALEAHIGQNHHDFELTNKWEMIHEAATKFRKLMTEGTEKLKVIALNDNPEVGAVIAEALDRILFYYIPFLDKLDAEIEAKTLTLEMYNEQHAEIPADFYAAHEEVSQLLQQLSIDARNKFSQFNQDNFIQMKQQVFTIKAYLLGEYFTGSVL